MVIRRRTRRFLIPVAFYSVSAAVAGFFVNQAYSGSRGVEAREQYEAQAGDLVKELETLKTERADWEHRIALLRSDQIDRDLLEERARIVLGRVHRNDLVIMLGDADTKP